MADIAPYLFERAETAPTVPAEGRFLLPVCITEEELSILLGAAIFYAEHSAENEIRHLIPLMQAMEFIGQPEYAECLGFFEDLNEPECDNYLPYAPFADYSPQNPYNEPDLVPDGYLVPPFMRNTSLEYPELLGYKASDVFVPFGAVNIAPENVFTLNYPTIKISVRGSGQIELDLLAVQQGGQVVMKIGSPPNIIDILQNLIIEEGVEIYDLDNEITSIPPEDDAVSEQEININAAVNETTDVYLVFLPKLNDSLLPLGFGGGIRSIGLCGFEQDAMMAGVEDVRYNTTTGGLDKRINGNWTEFASCEELVACAPTGGGGGGAGAAFKVKTLQVGVPTTNFTSITPTYQNVGSPAFNYTPTYSKMLVIIDNHTLVNSGNNDTDIRWLFGGNAAVDPTRARVTGTNGRQVQWSSWWQNLTPNVSQAFQLQGRVSAGTGTINSVTELDVTIIEFENPADIFVTAVRIQGRELQYQIAGVWITATDSLDAILDAYDSQISAINAVNNTQNTRLTNIEIVNGVQNTRLTNIETLNTTQNTRLTNLENDVDDLYLSVSVINAQIAALQAEMNVAAFGGHWAWIHDFTLGAYYSAELGSYAAGNGWVSDSGELILIFSGESIKQNQITHIQAGVISNFGSPVIITFNTDGVNDGVIEYKTYPNIGYGWYRVPNMDTEQFLTLRMHASSGDFVLKSLRYIGRGSVIPFD